MQFKNLEDKCLYYRGLTDYKLLRFNWRESPRTLVVG